MYGLKGSVKHDARWSGLRRSARRRIFRVQLQFYWGMVDGNTGTSGHCLEAQRCNIEIYALQID